MEVWGGGAWLDTREAWLKVEEEEFDPLLREVEEEEARGREKVGGAYIPKRDYCCQGDSVKELYCYDLLLLRMAW